MGDQEQLRVEGLPPSIRGKITALMNAAEEAAFAGSQPPESREEITTNLQWARYELERTIMTLLERKKAEGAQAFPSTTQAFPSTTQEANERGVFYPKHHAGMTKREYYALTLLGGILSRSHPVGAGSKMSASAIQKARIELALQYAQELDQKLNPVAEEKDNG